MKTQTNRNNIVRAFTVCSMYALVTSTLCNTTLDNNFLFLQENLCLKGTFKDIHFLYHITLSQNSFTHDKVTHKGDTSTTKSVLDLSQQGAGGFAVRVKLF